MKVWVYFLYKLCAKITSKQQFYCLHFKLFLYFLLYLIISSSVVFMEDLSYPPLPFFVIIRCCPSPFPEVNTWEADDEAVCEVCPRYIYLPF